MRAILIDPRDKTVKVVEYNGDYHHIYELIDAELFTCVRIGDKDENTIFVDDEGLINGKADTHGMFRFDGDNPAYLAGPGLILATNDEGESVACTLQVMDVYHRVAFGHFARHNGSIVFVEHNGERAWHVE